MNRRFILALIGGVALTAACCSATAPHAPHTPSVVSEKITVNVEWTSGPADKANRQPSSRLPV